eukprot:9493847-Pyramimonas_sp.AAC.3
MTRGRKRGTDRGGEESIFPARGPIAGLRSPREGRSGTSRRTCPPRTCPAPADGNTHADIALGFLPPSFVFACQQSQQSQQINR